jgi:hypothetical protein
MRGECCANTAKTTSPPADASVSRGSTGGLYAATFSRHNVSVDGRRKGGNVKKHEKVCSRATNPCTGYVVRVGGDWVDVEWHAGIRCVYRTRCRRSDVVPIAMQLAHAVSEANAPCHFRPEAQRRDVK